MKTLVNPTNTLLVILFIAGILLAFSYNQVTEQNNALSFQVLELNKKLNDVALSSTKIKERVIVIEDRLSLKYRDLASVKNIKPAN